MKTKPQLKTYKNYINHEWVASRKTRQVVNPFNGQPIATVAESSKKDVDDAIDAARAAFDRGPWRDSTAQQRGRILFAMADVVRKNAARLAELETLNCGKPIVESEFDMNDTPYGLAAAVWSRDIFRCLRMVKSLRAGIVWVNTMQPCYVEAPWGGYKQSGHGRELSLHGVEEFLETKQVHINLSERPIGWY